LFSPRLWQGYKHYHGLLIADFNPVQVGTTFFRCDARRSRKQDINHIESYCEWAIPVKGEDQIEIPAAPVMVVS